MEKILIVIITIIAIVLITALFIMFGWWLFVVPVFGLPSLSMTQAIGFSILLNAGKNSASIKG